MYKLSAILKWLEHSTAAFWAADGLPVNIEGWYPVFYICKPRENVSLHGGMEGIA